MAKRRSPKMIPPDYSIGKDVFPVVPFRTFMSAASADNVDDATIVAGNASQEVELDLDFESNEVFDVLAIQLSQSFLLADTTFTNIVVMLAQVVLTDDPDKAQTTPIHTENVIEGDESIVWFRERSEKHGTAVDTATVYQGTQQEYFILEQPWTVARNMKWIIAQSSTNAADFTHRLVATIWGRRRNAKDDEFKSIIYRQRF